MERELVVFLPTLEKKPCLSFKFLGPEKHILGWDTHHAITGVIETLDELYGCTFSSSTSSNKSCCLSCFNHHIKVIQDLDRKKKKQNLSILIPPQSYNQVSIFCILKIQSNSTKFRKVLWRKKIKQATNFYTVWRLCRCRALISTTGRQILTFHCSCCSSLRISQVNNTRELIKV